MVHSLWGMGDFDLETLRECESDAGLGNGGLSFADLILATPLKTLGSLKNVIPVFDVGDSSFDSHGSVKLSVR